MPRPGDGKLRLVGQSRPTAVWGGEVSPEHSHTDPLSCCRGAPEPRRRGPSSPQSPRYLLRGPFQRRCRCPFYAAVSRCDCLVGVHVCGWLQGAPRRRRHAHRQPQDLLWLEARPGEEWHGVQGGRSCSSPGASPAASGRPVLERTESPPLLPKWPFHACASTFELAQPVRDLPTGSVYLHGPQGGDEVLKSLWKKTSFRRGVRAQCSDPASRFRMLPCFPGDYRFPPSTRYSHLFTPSTLTPPSVYPESPPVPLNPPEPPVWLLPHGRTTRCHRRATLYPRLCLQSSPLACLACCRGL